MKKTIVKYRHAIIAIIMIVLNGVGVSASTPWTVNPGDYRYDMSLYLDVTFAATEMDYSLYDVGVFCGDECRGVAEVLPLGNGKSCLYVRVRSNQESGETMTFKYYDRETQGISVIDGVSFSFESNGRLGYPSDPFIVKIIRHFDVVLSAGDGGAINHDGGRIAEGTEINLTATPNEGYHFEKWSDDSTQNPRTLVVNGDLTLSAEFGVNTYKLTYMVDGVEYKSIDVDYGTSITAEPAPEKEGHTFSGWDSVPETMPAHDVTISGTFTINTYNAVFKIGDDVIATEPVVFGQPVVAPDAPAKEGHTFAGWQDVPATMPARDIEILGSYTVNKYKLTYTVDGASYKDYTVDYGTSITAEPAPEKEGHTFSGWDSVPETMPAHDVTVSGTFTINTYNAVFKIGDDVIATEPVVFGQPVIAPDAPGKVGHTFAGWQDVPATMPARDIEILGSYTVNKYKLTYTVDGASYKDYTVDYGTSITAEPAPEKEGYTFSGWDSVPETMPAHDVTVSGTFTINTYNAVFKIGDDVIATEPVVFGQPVIAPDAPAKEGHTFAGWQDVPATMPARDIEILGSYTVNKYKLTYTVDGASYKDYTVDYGTSITAEPAPEKEGHTFSGWNSVPETMPAHDVTVSGTFTINTYNAVFKIGDDVIATEPVVFGQPVIAPDAPAKEGHTFAGWQDVPATMPARDIEILGSYTVNKYKLTYIIEDLPYKEIEVEFGAVIIPETPEKEGYAFSGWDGLPDVMPSHDVTATGSFTINVYKITFRIDDEVIDSKSIIFGQPIVAPEVEEREGYTFAGWQDVPETMPAYDIEILGSYTVNQYKLTYIVDGDVYREYPVDYDTAITAEPAPEKEGHTFSGWEGVPETMPAHDVTVSGAFTINTYNAVFKIYDEIIETRPVVFGQPVIAPEAPVKEGYTFAGWQDVPETMPAQDIEILGNYDVNSYKLTYIVDEEPYKEVMIAFGAVIIPDEPEKEGHTFSGWDNLPETMPAHDITVRGCFTVNKYKLTLYLNDEIYSSEEVEYGAIIDIEEPTVPEDHKFDGWITEIPETMPAYDLDIYGTYSYFGSIASIHIDDNEKVTIYTTSGLLICKDANWYDVAHKLESALYIINGQKVIIRR